MYPIPTGTLPVTGANLLAVALSGGALMVVGVITLRLGYFRRKARATGLPLRRRGK
jgi:hypothetical protein